jgi:hypothetical protein
MFSGGDRPFIIAVRSTHAAVMTQIGKAVVDGVTVAGVIHSRNPVHRRNTLCWVRDTLLQLSEAVHA